MVKKDEAAVAAPTGDAAAPKKRTFRTFQYRGVPLEKLMDMSDAEVAELFPARQRRKFFRTTSNQKVSKLIRKLTKSKLECPYGEKPKVVKTHMRSVIITPTMIGSVVGVYNGKQFVEVEIKPEMLGHYLGEFSVTYRPVKHGRAGAAGSRFLPLK